MAALDRYYNVRIKLRNDSHTHWAEKEKITNEKEMFRPYDGEIIIYDILGKEEADKLGKAPIPFQMIKIGDGVTPIQDLPFINDISTMITTGSELGSIVVLDKTVYVKGLTPDEQQIYMAFQLIQDYYTKIETDSIIETVNIVNAVELINSAPSVFVLKQGGNELGTIAIAPNSIGNDKLAFSIQELLSLVEEQLSDGEGSINDRFNEMKQYIDKKINESGGNASTFPEGAIIDCTGVGE